MKIGIVGTGFIGQAHLEAIRRMPVVQVAAVAESNTELAAFVAERWEVPRVYAGHREMLADGGVDVVHVCTPNATHFEVALDAMRAGRHVYCEKPLATSAAQALQLAAALEEAGVYGAVNFNYRHNSMVEEMREQLAAGGAGRVLNVYGRYWQDWLLRDTDWDWRLVPELGGPSRAVADIGAHLFDTAQYVLQKRITAVYAQLFTHHPVRWRRDKQGTFSAAQGGPGEAMPVHSEDAAFILCRFEDGATGLFDVAQTNAGHKNDLSLQIACTNCMLEWRQEESDLLRVGRREGNTVLFRGSENLSDAARSRTRMPVGHGEGWSDVLRNAISAFYRSIEAGRLSPQCASIRDGAYIMRLIEACLQSSAEDRWVEIDA